MKDKLVLKRVWNKTSQQFLLLKHKVDWNGRYETPAGKARQRETPQALALRRLPDRPRKASTWSGNQQVDGGNFT
ncbi:NUDIX hydrolase [Peribacillus frigoritolerans]